MKTIISNRLSFVSPAFLCGSDQGRAELRSASIRGQLRWWFRVLGGEREDEKSVFGGVHDGTVASAIVVRVADVTAKHEEFVKPAPMSDLGYLLYFATVSGKVQGIRIRREAYFAPSTSFMLNISLRRELPEELEALLRKTIECFVRLGALGLRATRGCGAIAEENPLSAVEFLEWTKTLPEIVKVRALTMETRKDWRGSLSVMGSWLRAFRKDNHISSKEESALGFSNGSKRESSALRLRPVQVREGLLPVVVYTDAACSQPSCAELMLKRIP